MALKGERVEIETDITRTLSSATERGVVVCVGTGGSGVALGDRAGTAALVASMATSSGSIPAGLLMNDVVSVDETRYHRNFHKDEHKTGERCRLLRKGRVTTNKVTGTPADGGIAYVTDNGVLTPTKHATGGVAVTPPVGRFAGKLDEDGYVTVDINLPAVY